MFGTEEARAAKAASLKVPGWAWERKGRGELWVLGYKAGKRAYTPQMVEQAYLDIK